MTPSSPTANARWYAKVKSDPDQYAELLARHRERDRADRLKDPETYRARKKADNKRYRANLRVKLQSDPAAYAEHRRKINAHNRASYQRNPSPIKANNARRVAKVQAQITALKLSRGCVDCGYTAAAEALHFDHLDPTQKVAAISSMKTNSAASVAAEIAKCVVRCANCHAIRTVQQQRERSGRFA